jgi:hypothetical protein
VNNCADGTGSLCRHSIETEQIMACLLAEMKAGQDETKVEIRTNKQQNKLHGFSPQANYTD